MKSSTGLHPSCLPMDSSPLTACRSLSIILLVATAFRFLGPWLQQSTGDSPHYVALAMKLRTSGFAGYNLRGIAIKTRSLNGSKIQHVMELRPSPSSDPEGDLMRDLRARGLGYYDEPLHHNPYGEAMLLASIHFLMGKPSAQGWELLNCSVNPQDLIQKFPWQFPEIQWQWLVPSFLFSLGAIALTFCLGRKWFDASSGFWAALLMAIFPVDILTAQRVWSDDALVFFCLLSLWSGWLALERKSALWAVCSGFFVGIAFLFKQSALIFVLAVSLAEIIRWRRSRLGFPQFLPLPSFALLGIWVLGGLMATLHWFLLEWKAWGRIFPTPPGLASIASNPWHQTLMHRPWPIILYTVGLAVLSPLLWMGWKEIRDRRTQWLFLAFAFFILLLAARGGREYRYALPVIPFLAIAASPVLARANPKRKWMAPLLVIAQMIWSLFLTYRYAWQNWGEIMNPF